MLSSANLKALVLFAALPIIVSAQLIAQPSSASEAAITPAEKAVLADRVRTETLHAWNAYKKYAWGHDELQIGRAHV